jgi:uncharacterized protein YndB with AHSA1/START domain
MLKRRSDVDQLKLEAQAKAFVRAPRERVYDAFATANGLNGWFTKGAEVDPRPGGKMLFRFENWGPEHNINERFPGKVLEAKRPERFVFEWGEPGKATTVEIVLEVRGKGTLVSVREYGFADTPEGRKSLLGNAEGWGEVVILAKFFLEHGLVYDSAGH